MRLFAAAHAVLVVALAVKGVILVVQGVYDDAFLIVTLVLLNLACLYAMSAPIEKDRS